MSVPRHPGERSLSLLAGGDLGLPARWLVAMHVRRCPQCSEAVAAFREVSAQLRQGLPLPQVDFDALVHQIRVGAAATGAEAHAPTGRQWNWKAVAGAAMGAAGLALALTLPLRDSEREAVRHPEPAGVQATLLHEGTETRVTAQGRLAVRAFHSGSGTVTVTDYYAP